MKDIIMQIKNFLPYDFDLKLILSLMALVIVYGILRLYEINKKDVED